MDDIKRTEDFQHSIHCPVCDIRIDYIGNLDKDKELNSDRVKAGETYILFDKGFHTTEGYRLALETVITCPNCSVKIKTTAATSVID